MKPSDFTSFLESQPETHLYDIVKSAYRICFETYQVKHIDNKKPVITDINPTNRSIKNIPKFANGKNKVNFRDWLGFSHIINNSVAKGTDGKWYGWSHRAIHGFDIGDDVKKGDCAYNGKEYTIKTEKQAKETAIRFADSVS